MLANLRPIVDRYRSAGARYFVLARTIRGFEELATLGEALAMPLRVVELTVPFEVIARRLATDPTEARQSGPRPKRAWISEHSSRHRRPCPRERPKCPRRGRRNPRLARLAHTIEDLTINIGSWRGCAERSVPWHWSLAAEAPRRRRTRPVCRRQARQPSQHRFRRRARPQSRRQVRQSRRLLR